MPDERDKHDQEADEALELRKKENKQDILQQTKEEKSAINKEIDMLIKEETPAGEDGTERELLGKSGGKKKTDKRNSTALAVVEDTDTKSKKSNKTDKSEEKKDGKGAAKKEEIKLPLPKDGPKTTSKMPNAKVSKEVPVVTPAGKEDNKASNLKKTPSKEDKQVAAEQPKKAASKK